MNDFVVIIPSRISSTRLKEKALLDLYGKSLIERVYLRAIKSNASEVYIATDSPKIEDHVKQFTSNVLLTSKKHQSGTDRVHECATKIHLAEDMAIVNVQGDEPFINPETINKTAEIISNNNKASVGSACTLLNPNGLNDPNNVKVLLSEKNKAISFSRNLNLNNSHTDMSYYQHIGIYSYSYKTLSELVSLPRSKNEISKNLEQLRFLDNGYNIFLEVVDEISFGIDTQDDYKKALRILNDEK